jgi:hypothetical protein
MPPACNCGTKPCGFYVFNHSSDVVVHGQTFRDWFVTSYMLNAVGMSPLVSGYYWDDYFSPSGDMGDNTPNATQDMGLTPADLQQLTDSYRANMAVLTNATIASGRFAWQLFLQMRVSNATCAADLRTYCAASSPTQSRATLFLLSQQSPAWTGVDVVNDISNFLLVRGPFAWLGLTWMGCSRDWRTPDELNLDVGEPAALCSETALGSGIFSREYSKVTVTTDCNTWSSSVCEKEGGQCLQPLVQLRTFLKKFNASAWDHAPCATRDCSVYLNADFVEVFTEGTCVLPGHPNTGEEMVNVKLFFSALDNMGAPSPPGDGQGWAAYDLECLAFANSASGRWPLEVWHSALRNEYWTLANPASRANATAEGYTLVSSIGFVAQV